MKYRNLAIVVLILALVLVGCTNVAGTVDSKESMNEVEASINTEPVSTSETIKDDKVITIVTTLYPNYDFAQIVGGDKVSVTMIVPPGVEPHSYEPTPRDMMTIEKADLFIYTSEEMEPWAHKIIENINGDGKVMAISEGIEEEAHEEEHAHSGEEAHEEEHAHGEEEAHEEEHAHGEEEAHEEEGHEGHNHENDPHIWLDPLKAIHMVENITNELVTLDPENKAYYEANSSKYIEELKVLDQEIRDAVAGFTSTTIYSGGHFAFGHFIERYGLQYESPFEGFAPDAEPSPKRIAALIDAVNNENISVIYYEELVNPRISQVIADETNAQMLMLHAAHNLSKDEFAASVSYLSIMRQNLENLTIGLGK